MGNDEKPLIWLGGSRKDLAAMPKAVQREFGYAEVRARGHTPLLKDIADFHTPEGHGMLKVWMSHGDKVTELPAGFKATAVYVLHCFKKKSTRGIETPKPDMDLIRKRLDDAKRLAEGE